ncbi:MAG: efflux RND transporter periplasmic adaptor subunit [Gemmatimonadaceae bacterium]
MTSRFKNTQFMGRRLSVTLVIVAAVVSAAACGGKPEIKQTASAGATGATGPVYTVRDTVLLSAYDAAGVVTPIQQATVSTKLMGTITEVLVKEGDAVATGQPLVRIDARDIAAKSAQVAASIAEAEATQRDALAQAKRVRALYADSVATRAQLDAVETGVARADAAVRSAHAAADELDAMSSYAVVRSPFSGTVTKRFVDPGAFAAPGAPLIGVQDASQLRIVASVAPDVAALLRRGASISGSVEGRPIVATIEGVVPSGAGNLSTINAIVSNPNRALAVGSAATLFVSSGRRTAVVVPATAIVHQGDLTGLRVATATGTELRWVRLGTTAGSGVEVTSGIQAGDRVLLGPAAPAVAARN